LAELSHIESPDRGVLVLDSEGRITLANQRACEVLNVSFGELIGSRFTDVVKWASCAPNGSLEEVVESLPVQGSVVHRYSSPLRDAEGKITGRVEVYSDITRRRELEREILDSNRVLAELNKQLKETQEQLLHSERLRAVGEMAAGIAHDINNVLGIIIGNTQIARRKLGANSPIVESIDAIESAARDAAETVRRLREISKPVDSSSFRPVDLASIASSVLKTAVPALSDGKSVCYKERLENGLWIMGVESELREALNNVLLNAAQAVGNEGTVEVTVVRDGDWAEVAVSDDGPGMDSQTVERVFDPFFTTRGAEGTGLGMSMVDAIVTRHGGRVSVESEPGHGARVAMRFPLSRIGE
jgi:two-component system NtrC family sensor kinase